jgi:hypothetical protein
LRIHAREASVAHPNEAKNALNGPKMSQNASANRQFTRPEVNNKPISAVAPPDK